MRGTAAATPEEWMALWGGWQRDRAEQLHAALLEGAAFSLAVKWGNLLFVAGGPCALIHVEDHRVLLGFFRGKRLRELAPAIRASGKYELGNISYGPDTAVDGGLVTRLATAAAALNAELGDPTRRT